MSFFWSVQEYKRKSRRFSGTVLLAELVSPHTGYTIHPAHHTQQLSDTTDSFRCFTHELIEQKLFYIKSKILTSLKQMFIVTTSDSATVHLIIIANLND